MSTWLIFHRMLEGTDVLASSGGFGDMGDQSFIFLAFGVVLAFLLIHLTWHLFNRDEGSSPEPHSTDGMIRCPECGSPTESEYRFCRICASDTGKDYGGLGSSDDSSKSGMF